MPENGSISEESRFLRHHEMLGSQVVVALHLEGGWEPHLLQGSFHGSQGIGRTFANGVSIPTDDPVGEVSIPLRGRVFAMP